MKPAALRSDAQMEGVIYNEGRAKTADAVRELMSGNICRCGAYPNIVTAIQQALRRSDKSAEL